MMEMVEPRGFYLYWKDWKIMRFFLTLQRWNPRNGEQQSFDKCLLGLLHITPLIPFLCKCLTMENQHVFMGKSMALRTWTRCDLPGLPGYTDPKNGLQRMEPMKW